MSLEAISIAATIALASTTAILVAVKSFSLISFPFGAARRFRKSIMIETAQRFRDQWEKLNREQLLYLTLSLMFVATFCIAVVLRPQNTFGSLPTWQSVTVLLVVATGAGYGLFRFINIVIARRKIAFLRDANIAVGHSLLKLSASQKRIFHEVPVMAGIIDNVVVGLTGIYAVSVIARPPGKDNRVRLEGDKLAFAPGDQPISLADCATRAQQLASALKKQVGHSVRVRPVIAVPGWEVESQASEHFLAVNERNLAMMRGWKDEKDYLMNEDVDAINAFLTALGTRK